MNTTDSCGSTLVIVSDKALFTWTFAPLDKYDYSSGKDSPHSLHHTKITYQVAQWGQCNYKIVKYWKENA